MLPFVPAGIVESWFEDEGWGVIKSDATPGGCWTHFSAVVMDGYRTLTAGDRVSFTFERANQDGYSYRAREVWPLGIEPATTISWAPTSTGSGAYQSRMTITLDDGSVLFAD